MDRDDRGVALTVGSGQTLEAINRFQRSFLAGGTDFAAILESAEQDKHCAVAQCLSAVLMMFMENHESHTRALHYIAAAVDAAQHALPHERLLVEAVSAWVRHDPLASLGAFDAALEIEPRWLAVARLMQTRRIGCGDWAGMLRTLLPVLAANHDDAHALGMTAFAYEQCHLLDRAEAAARRAIGLNRNEVWAQHALAHALETTGRIDEGITTLRVLSDGWVGLNSFMHTHIWWHLALFMLDRERYDEVLALFDSQIWGIDKTYSQDQAGAVAMLARLEGYGVPVGQRWDDVADHLAGRVDDHVEPFLDLHYVYGLARTGRPQARDLVASMAAHAEMLTGAARAPWAEVAVPLARGLLKLGEGEARAAVPLFAQTRSRWNEIGGSHAQRDLFEQLYIRALIEAGDLGAAQQLVELRRLARPHVAPTHRLLARLYDGLGLRDLGAAATATAQRLAADAA